MSLATERRAARERALGLLYEAEAKGSSGDELLATLPVEPDDFAVALVRAVDEHRAQIDELLSRFAKGWTLSRMPALDRAALRMGTAELIARPDVPTGVVLAETVELASRFSTDDSGRFVNGLLARIAQEVRGHGASVRATGPGQVDDAGSGAEAGSVAAEIDGVIIDLDGVIRHWDGGHHREVEERLGLPPGAFSEVALEDDRLERVTDGRLPFEAWCDEVGGELARRHGIDPAAGSEAWATATWHIDLVVLELLARVRGLVPVALLSNASTNLLVDLDRSGISDAFDAIVGSAHLGVGKPDERAFQSAADGIGVPLERCLFIDDTLGHVEAARALGVRAERFTGPEELRETLESLGLLR